MELDTDQNWSAPVLALLLLGLHDGCRVWKTFDWDAMNRLHEKGLISDPVGKSVVLTEDGQREAQRLVQSDVHRALMTGARVPAASQPDPLDLIEREPRRFVRS